MELDGDYMETFADQVTDGQLVNGAMGSCNIPQFPSNTTRAARLQNCQPKIEVANKVIAKFTF